MSYLKEQVQTAKKVSGYHGRKAPHFKYLEEKSKEGEKMESDKKSKILRWGMVGLFVLGGGYVGYKFYKNHYHKSGQSSFESKFEGQPKPPSRESINKREPYPLDKFMKKVPDSSVTNDIKEQWSE